MASFWFGYSVEDFLFKGLDVHSKEGFAGLFVALVSVSIICEGVRTLRDLLLRRYADARHVTLSSATSSNTSVNSVRYKPQGTIDVVETDDFSQGPSTRCHDRRPSPEAELEAGDGEDEDSKFVVSSSHPYRRTTQAHESHRSNMKQWIDLSLSTLFHMVYVALGYILMLAVMTWNVYVLIAVSLGIGIGYLFFGSLRYKKDKVLQRKSMTKGDCCDALLSHSSPINSHLSDYDHGDGLTASGSGDCSGVTKSANHCNNGGGAAVTEPGPGGDDGQHSLHHRVTVVGAQVHTTA